MKKLLFIFSALVIFTNSSFADSTKTLISDSTLKINKQEKTSISKDFVTDLGILATDWGAYLTTPLRMNAKEVFLLSAFFAGTVVASTTDYEIRMKYYRFGYETYNGDFWDIPTFYGYVQYPSILGGAMYGIGLFARSKWLRTTGRQLIQALIYGGTVTMAVRYLTGRRRPYTSIENQYEFKAFETDGELTAFPSGHTVVAMTTSTVLAERIDTWWARAVLYPFAALTGIARMYNDKHWLTDVIVGAALGYGSGMFVINQEEEREQEALKKNKKRKTSGGSTNFFPTGNGIRVNIVF
jgi:membrane-associated phospholipid phosphatase